MDEQLVFPKHVFGSASVTRCPLASFDNGKKPCLWDKTKRPPRTPAQFTYTRCRLLRGANYSSTPMAKLLRFQLRLKEPNPRSSIQPASPEVLYSASGRWQHRGASGSSERLQDNSPPPPCSQTAWERILMNSHVSLRLQRVKKRDFTIDTQIKAKRNNMISELITFRITKAKAKVKFGVKYLCGHECERSSVQLISIRKRKRRNIFRELISL